MGFFDRFKSRPLADFKDVAESTGFMLGTAASRVRSTKQPLAALVLCDPLGDPKLLELDGADALATWEKANGDKYPRYCTAIGVQRPDMPALRVSAVDRGPPRIHVTVTAPYFPHTAPAGFELHTEMEFETSGDPEILEALQEHFVAGLHANKQAQEWLPED